MFETITRRINGGLNGLDDRLKYYSRAKDLLGVLASRDVLAPESERGVTLPPEFTRGREVIDLEQPVKKRRKPQTRKAKRTTAKPAKKKAAKKTGGRKSSKRRPSGKNKPKVVKRRK